MPTRQSRLLLLIDDDPAQGRLVSALAAREGWRTQIVATGSDALALLAAIVLRHFIDDLALRATDLDGIPR